MFGNPNQTQLSHKRRNCNRIGKEKIPRMLCDFVCCDRNLTPENAECRSYHSLSRSQTNCRMPHNGMGTFACATTTTSPGKFASLPGPALQVKPIIRLYKYDERIMEGRHLTVKAAPLICIVIQLNRYHKTLMTFAQFGCACERTRMLTYVQMNVPTQTHTHTDARKNIKCGRFE